MYNLQDIKTIHLEVTQRCQASCPMCDRNKNGGEVNSHIDMSELTLADCKRIFSPEFIKQLNVMYMCGNLGDPIVAQDTLEIFKYFREHNKDMWLSMNTNGGARNSEWWTELAKTFGRMGTVIFSVDGLIDTNHIYRRGVNWQAVHNAMTSFIAAGGRARWDFLIFDYNEHQVEEAEQMSKDMGFEKFIKKKSARFVDANNVKKKTHTGDGKRGKVELSEPSKTEFKNKELSKQDLLLQKYGSMDNYHDVVEVNCKVKDEGNLFVTAEGLLMPCCWTAGRMYKWWHTDYKVEQVWDFIDGAGGKDAINAKVHGMQKVFDSGIFETIEESWSKPSCSEGKLKVCAMKCGKEFDPFKAQFDQG